MPRSKANQLKYTVDSFNRNNPVGTKVRYWTFEREGDGKIGFTIVPAEVLSGHTAVVWISGCSSCAALSHVEVL
jgi:hypothetical protein